MPFLSVYEKIKLDEFLLNYCRVVKVVFSDDEDEKLFLLWWRSTLVWGVK